MRSTKKYKELAAFKTNEFKIGDMVRAYELSFRTGYVEGKILNIKGDEICFSIPDMPLVFHFKQCRKLEEVKPREFWTYRVYLQDPSSNEGALLRVLDEAIKVREVLDDE
jgi:hypothetical protein